MASAQLMGICMLLSLVCGWVWVRLHLCTGLSRPINYLCVLDYHSSRVVAFLGVPHKRRRDKNISSDRHSSHPAQQLQLGADGILGVHKEWVSRTRAETSKHTDGVPEFDNKPQFRGFVTPADTS